MTLGAKEAIPALEDGLLVPHFDHKAQVTEYLKTSGMPYTASSGFATS